MHKFIIGILVVLLTAGVTWLTPLAQQVMQLERRLAPLIACQSMENRQHTLRDRFIILFLVRSRQGEWEISPVPDAEQQPDIRAEWFAMDRWWAGERTFFGGTYWEYTLIYDKENKRNRVTRRYFGSYGEF